MTTIGSSRDTAPRGGAGVATGSTASADATGLVDRNWRNPKTWPPPGRGCRLCSEGTPVVEALCRMCLIRIFPWQWNVIEKWIGRQAVAYSRQQDRREALKRWREDEDPQGIIEYAERYGVWLVPQEELRRR